MTPASANKGIPVVQLDQFFGGPAEALFDALTTAMASNEIVHIERGDKVVAIGASPGFVQEALVEGVAPVISKLPSMPEQAE